MSEAEKKYRSDEIGLIMAALAKAQGSYRQLIPNEETPGGKFANLSAILSAVREALAQNGIGFYQYVELLDEGSGAALLKTLLGHESGQWILSCARVISGKTDRATGNSYEFHRRLHALMILGVAPSKNDPLLRDDNGEEQAEQFVIEQVKMPAKERTVDDLSTVDKSQYNMLLSELEGYSEVAADLMETYHIETLADLPKSEYHKAINKIRKIRKAHEEYLERKK